MFLINKETFISARKEVIILITFMPLLQSWTYFSRPDITVDQKFHRRVRLFLTLA